MLAFSRENKGDDNHHLDFTRTYRVPGSVLSELTKGFGALNGALGSACPAPGPQFRARPRGVALRPRYPGGGGGGRARAAHSSRRGRGAQTMRGAALARARAAVGTKEALLTRVP